jgi:hypothetical protein
MPEDVDDLAGGGPKMTSMKRWKGLRALLTDAVEQGTSAVERVHRATAARPFDILDHIPGVAPGSRAVRLVHDVTVAGVYETIRQVNRVVGATLSTAIDVVEKAGAHPAGDATVERPDGDAMRDSTPAAAPATRP